MEGAALTLSEHPSAGIADSSNRKFDDPRWTAKGEPRAAVPLRGLKTLWFNTGTLCNIACEGCYIASSPRNDRLGYLTRDEVNCFLQEARRDHGALGEIGFTGGEPFMNPDIDLMIGDALACGYRVLVLTNAMAPMRHHRQALSNLMTRFPHTLALRVSLDDFSREGHERLRGPGTWETALDGLKWLSTNGFDTAVAVRLLDRDERSLRLGFDGLFSEHEIAIDARDPHRLVVFPEMDDDKAVPEISEHCWAVLGKTPADVMCATSRMVVRRKHDDRPVVVSCTLIPYDDRFAMGRTLAEANRPVRLNHPHCAKFCVLGGASCNG